MARRNVYEENYARLEDLLGEAPEQIAPGRIYRLCSQGYMDLVIEKLSPSPTHGATLISVAHYFERDGDLCQDPEVILRVFPPGESRFQELAPSTNSKIGRIEALLFQRAIPPSFRAVYPEPGRFDPRLKRELNSFLSLWLRNLKAQGHRLMDAEAPHRPTKED